MKSSQSKNSAEIMLKDEFQYFIDHQEELVKLYTGKYIVIYGQNVVGAYDSEMDALIDSESKYEPGTFLIQKCTSGKQAYTQTFHSRVAFA